MLDTLIELALISYPLFKTVNYVSLRVVDQNTDEKVKFNPKDVHFLATWWSAYGILNIFEDMLAINNIPLYGVARTGVLVSLMFKDYQNVILKKTADGVIYIKTRIGETEFITTATNKFINIIQNYQSTQKETIAPKNEDGYIDSILKKIKG